MSAPEVLMGYVAGHTDYIHLSSGINSLSPRKEHPVRLAERAAMLDHVTGRRYEWGTGRGAGSHEMASFNILDTASTKPEWETVVREIPRMWEQKDYEYHGDFFTVPTPHNVLPKPYGQGHPPIWVACGNPPTFARAGELGIGAIAFNFEPIFNLKGRIDAYKEAIANCKEPLGQFMNNNVMMTNAVLCFEDRDKARKLALERVSGYLVTMVNLYHDTMPKSPDAITWPGAPIQLKDLAAGGDPEELLDQMIAGGYMLVGNPEEVSEQLEAYKSVGCDQLVFGMPQDLHKDEIFELLEVFGDQVIRQHDPDPVHSTDKYRATAKPKYPAFNNPLPEVEWPTVLPVTALEYTPGFEVGD
jgi:alkanesulfonate monooxygenase SsuD/methylene tetrahydromethanopterin reductase-like flavin-dependent oxidoreductase (luciferase family)